MSARSAQNFSEKPVVFAGNVATVAARLQSGCRMIARPILLYKERPAAT